MLTFRCESCSKLLKVQEALNGKRVRCPDCNAVNTVVKRSSAPADSPSIQSPSIQVVPTIQVAAAKPAKKAATGKRSTPGATRHKKKRGNPGMWLIGGSILGMAAVGVAAIFLLGGKTNGPVASQTSPDSGDTQASSDLIALPAEEHQDAPLDQPTDQAQTAEGEREPTSDPLAPMVHEPLPEDPVAITAQPADAVGGHIERPQTEAGRQDASAGHSDAITDSVAAPDDLATTAGGIAPAVDTGLPQPTLDDRPLLESDDDARGTVNPSGLTDQDQQQLAELHRNRQLFSVKEYPTLRRIFADRFARLNEVQIRAAWGEDLPAMQQWLADHPAIREQLFLAIDPQTDDVVRALQIFQTLKETFPEQIVPYANLAIAIAVTWDQPQHIYHYSGHQRRAKATMPDGLTDEIDNFRYFLETEPVMQGRAQWLPWEFLVHVVNHRTPREERNWALQHYLAGRVMFGKCYQDVPYDYLMLESQSQHARMNDHPYTLANLRTYGGVCALQGDFASRVGQSLGVPSAYVGGESAYGDLHAWVMWVEIKAVTPKSIVFSLESHGRYRGDRYYVGTLRDPKSGRQITDRQLELRLHTVGSDPVAKRHADLVMAAYPLLQDQLELNTSDRFDYLRRTVELCLGHDQAWQALADMATLDEVKQKHRKQMTRILDQLFRTFANFPDFTWTIFDDLIQFEDRLKERIKLYERLTILYQAAQRPDLACEARLRLSDLLVEDGRELEAVDGLAATIYAFVDEGRYVPRMLDRIESICQGLDGATPHLLRFYHSFLPRIPQMRGDRPSRYCMEMFERGIALFRQHGETALAQTYENQLAQIRAGQGRR